ncbi:MAG: stage V sporulation protein AC [Lachnospiraceae bacterium]|jgi:stage V sporulation protein AC|nr:stage V sporulation protein AC [Lachnospiraceae bacterium]
MEENELQKKQYQEYVKQVTPKHNLWTQILKAFLMGGVICTIGQFLLNFLTDVLKQEKLDAMSWCSLILVFLAALLTGFDIYQKLVKWGGAGALVPITGFANSVCAPAIEYKKEGQIFGIGSKIFTIAGPVILYGVFTSWALGIVYLIWSVVTGR